MSASEEFRSWTAPADERDRESERRRQSRGRWVRPATAVVVLAVAGFDAALLLVVTAVRGFYRNQTTVPCATFWRSLAHDTTVGLVVLLAVLVVTVVATVRWRWIFVAVLTCQLVVAAVLIPATLHQRSQFLAVQDGRLPVSAVDTGGAYCDR